MNPYINSCYSLGLTEIDTDRRFDIIFDISMMSQKYEETPIEMDLYF